jgi:hypothetical protein
MLKIRARLVELANVTKELSLVISILVATASVSVDPMLEDPGRE